MSRASVSYLTFTQANDSHIAAFTERIANGCHLFEPSIGHLYRDAFQRIKVRLPGGQTALRYSGDGEASNDAFWLLRTVLAETLLATLHHGGYSFVDTHSSAHVGFLTTSQVDWHKPCVPLVDFKLVSMATELSSSVLLRKIGFAYLTSASVTTVAPLRYINWVDVASCGMIKQQDRPRRDRPPMSGPKFCTTFWVWNRSQLVLQIS